MDQRIEIANLVGALAVRADARQWDDLVDLFAPEVQVDYTSLFGGEPQATSREQLIDAWRQLLPGFTHTTHLIGAPFVTVSGEDAQCSASVIAWHSIKDSNLAANDHWIVGGCYEMKFKKLGRAWRISGLTLARAWAEGNLDLPRIARERLAASGSRE
jgi:SnoaL-like domain